MKVWICQWNIPCNIKPRLWLNLGTRCPSFLPLPVWSPGWLWKRYIIGRISSILMSTEETFDAGASSYRYEYKLYAQFDAGLKLRFPLWSSSEHFSNSRQWYRWLTQSSLVISFSRYFNYISCMNFYFCINYFKIKNDIYHPDFLRGRLKHFQF